MNTLQLLKRVSIVVSFVTLLVFSIVLEVSGMQFQTHRNVYFVFFALAGITLLLTLFIQ